MYICIYCTIFIAKHEIMSIHLTWEQNMLFLELVDSFKYKLDCFNEQKDTIYVIESGYLYINIYFNIYMYI